MAGEEKEEKLNFNDKVKLRKEEIRKEVPENYKKMKNDLKQYADAKIIVAKEAYDRGVQLVGDAKNTIVEGTKKVGEKSLNGVKSFFGRLTDGAGQLKSLCENARNNILEHAGEKVTKGKEYIENAINDVVNTVEDGVTNVTNDIKNGVTNVKNKIKDSAETVATKAGEVKDSLVNGATNVKNSVKDSVEKMATKAGEVKDNATNKVKDVGNKTKETVEDVAVTVVAAGSLVKDETVKLGKEAGKKIKGKFTDVKGSINKKAQRLKEGLDGVANGAKGIFNDVKDGAKDTYETVVERGMDAKDAVVNGIKDVGNKTKETTENVAVNVVALGSLVKDEIKHSKEFVDAKAKGIAKFIDEAFMDVKNNIELTTCKGKINFKQLILKGINSFKSHIEQSILKDENKKQTLESKENTKNKNTQKMEQSDLGFEK